MMNTLACNVVWFLSCLPGAVAFVAAACLPRVSQRRILRRILSANAATEYGESHTFASIRTPHEFAARVPPSEFGDYRDAIDAIRGTGDHTRIVAEEVRVLEPTSGTGSSPKLVPYTRSLRREFLAGIRPWMAGLYLRTPSLFLGRQYWSVSPNTRPVAVAGDGVRVGFENDTEYLGALGRRLSRRVMAAPPELARVEDPEAFEYLTLLFLVRDAGLRLMSVWHPSFLTILLDALPSHWPALVADIRSGRIREDLELPAPLRCTLQALLRPSPARAEALAAVDPGRTDGPMSIWPRLRVISCWEVGAESWLSRLRLWFPAARVQGKGLVATEGIVTIPLGAVGPAVVAVRSHFLEFRERATGVVRRAWELEQGRDYTVLLTTGGGLYRYCLHDVVRAEGRFLRTPRLRFLGREGCVSDMVGEKLDLCLAEEAIAWAQEQTGQSLGFAMLAPERDPDGRCGYVCYAAAGNGRGVDWTALADGVEAHLAEAYHYRHARRLGQLQPVRVFELTGAPDVEYREHCARNGMKRGDVKFLRLSRQPGWGNVFEGRFVAQSGAVAASTACPGGPVEV